MIIPIGTNDSGATVLARDRKTARSLAILVGVYFIKWAPYEICALVNPLCNFCIPGKVFDVTFWLLWINSTINPILYPFLQVKFRVAFRKLLCSHCIQPSTQVRPTNATVNAMVLDIHRYDVTTAA